MLQLLFIELDVTVSDAATAETTPVALTPLAVKKFLKVLSNADLKELGLELGLKNVRLKNMMIKDCMLDDMLESWLREDDNVTKISGHPSWESLLKALEEADYTGVAVTIKKGMSFIQVNCPRISMKYCLFLCADIMKI